MGTYKGVFKTNLAFLKTILFRGGYSGKDIQDEAVSNSVQKTQIPVDSDRLGVKRLLVVSGFE